ncbi:AMP-binding protein [Motiliproteus coralliicola]|uniref:AMP-binding protein n=1 Tax=Motiliproteus coralliicola TaxID=2283196 RepID=A0A369WT56_9GAMM|nr:AMP-binding protein [Motiliproteus coralliicola]RDE24333.1 AMP-binding protein [Motiliproteus coralliicola]
MTEQTYQDYIAKFTPQMIESQFSGQLSEAPGINVCVESCDRHVQQNPDKAALRYQRIDGSKGELSFAELQRRSAQFANMLKSQGIGKGDRVACLLPRTPELLIAVLGTLRAGGVYQPLFTAFGSGAIEYRLNCAGSKLIITNPEQWPKLADVKNLPKTMLVADSSEACASESDLLWQQAVDSQDDQFEPVLIGQDEPFLQMFTSGTTGKSKGVVVPAKALVSFWTYMELAIGLRDEDNYWNVADPGWAYGLYYAVVGPLLLGCTTHFNEHGFTADNTYAFMQEFEITNLAAAPTAYRLLMANEAQRADYNINLRVASSAGEPLNPEVANWMDRVFSCPVRDHYGQTETGMTACNYHALDHEEHVACMGFPMPGYRLVALDDEFNEVEPGQTGQLAVDVSQSPQFFFMGYSFSDKKPYHGNYYLTGDMVIRNADGSHSYTGRDDDIITSAGYRIGPADVESTLLEHPAVIESAVVAKPCEKRGSIVKAYAVIREQDEPNDALVEELQQYVRNRLSTHSFPREIEFVTELPKTPSGKLQRFLLRQRAVDELDGQGAA